MADISNTEQVQQAQAPKSSGLATTSLILGAAGTLCCLPSLVGIPLGFVALGQIKASGGKLTGAGQAKLGLALGFASVALWIAMSIFGNISMQRETAAAQDRVNKLVDEATAAAHSGEMKSAEARL